MSFLKIRPRLFVPYFVFAILISGRIQDTIAFAGLSDFGGDVSQYMTLLKGTSAFSFKPGSRDSTETGTETEGKFERELLRDSDQGHRRQEAAGSKRSSKTGMRSESAIGDFGGDYGNYLQLLEGDSALGFNPQSDPIADNQDLQSDVFGGGMTGKFWNMYKGSTSYDSFDESDSEILESSRQSPESDQPEDESNPLRGQRGSGDDETVIVAVKPSKEKLSKLVSDFKNALKLDDKGKMEQILDSIKLEKLLPDGALKKLKEKSRQNFDEKSDYETTRESFYSSEDNFEVPDLESRSSKSLKSELAKKNSEESTEDSKETQKETESRSTAQKLFEDFVEKLRKNIPDPVATNKGLSMSYRNLTLYGLAEMKVCGPIKKSLGFETWSSTICLPRLATTIDCVTGPGVPFRGKVAGIFKSPKIKISFRENGSNGIHVTSVKTIDTVSTKFVPTYDSSIPLNPWSKVSLSGYMVARVKKILPSLVDKTILKITRVVESIDDES